MSISQFALGESSLAAQPDSATKKPPPKRQSVAQADPTLQPEPR